MKRIVSLIIVMTLAMGVSPLTASAAEEDVLSLLAEFEIMTGDPDGDLRLDDYVSRAEFTKIAVAASAYKNSVAANLAISPFPDVTYKHWAAPYVRVGVTNGIVSGYPDATFKPEDTVLYEEAITMLLRVLGYSDEDFGVSWPVGQLGLADNLDMTDNVGCNAGDIMNRRQVATLVYNTLKVKQKNSANTLLSVFDTVLYEDVTLIASSDEDTSIVYDEIYTTSGLFKIDPDFNKAQVGLKGDMYVKNQNRLIGFVPDEVNGAVEEYIVYSVLADKIMVYHNGAMIQLEINNDTKAYKGKSQTQFSTIKSQLKLGDKLIARRTEAGDIDYITYEKGEAIEAVTAMNENWRSMWNIDENTSITRDGMAASAADIQNYDILYYLSDLNIMLAYTGRVTGIYEKATPNRDIPASVTVSGKEYELEGSTAFNKLYSGGEFEYGDTVTLLLGKDNKVADVIAPALTEDGVVGYLTYTGTKEYSGGNINTFTDYYISIVSTDGVTYEYITDRDYSESLNSVVELDFVNGYARLTPAKSEKVSGVFEWKRKRMGLNEVSSQIEILDVGTKNSDDQSEYAKVFGQRIDGVEISATQVLYSEKNSKGEIVKLILDNVTNDAFDYGILTSVTVPGKDSNQMSAGRSTYECLINGNRYSVTRSGRYGATRVGPVKICGKYTSPSTPDAIIPLEIIKEKITNISEDRISAGSKIYKLSDRISVYKKLQGIDSNYVMISLNEVIRNKDKYNISAYYDKLTESGGRVRIIIVSE